jgi:hypothetical protein
MQKKDVKLKDVLSLVKNKRNFQYSFVLKKRAMFDLGISPKSILNISMLPQKKIKLTPSLKKPIKK